MNKFKYRAECVEDARKLNKALGDRGIDFRSYGNHISIESKRPSFPNIFNWKTHVHYLPDAEVELNIAISIEEVLEVMREIPDSHVMIQTLNYAESYTGVRDREKK